MSTDTLTPALGTTALPLRRLYLVRFVFAAVWAGLFATSASSLGAFTVALLVLYPAVDVAAAIVDRRTARRTDRASTGLYANVAVSTLAAVGLAVAASHDVPAVLRVWGTWAVAAGVVQLAVGLARRPLGGQGAMIASGGLSVLVGALFVGSASGRTTMTSIAGYAALGGIFFLVSALRLRRPDDPDDAHRER